jgi:hypothetical protein
LAIFQALCDNFSAKMPKAVSNIGSVRLPALAQIYKQTDFGGHKHSAPIPERRRASSKTSISRKVLGKLFVLASRHNHFAKSPFIQAK